MRCWSSFTGGRVVGSLNLPSRGIFTSSLHQTLEKPIPLSKALGLSCPILSFPGHPPISSSEREPKQRGGAPGTSPHSAWPQNCGWYHFSEESWTTAHLLLWKLYPFLHTQDSTMKTSGNVSGTRSLRTWGICCYFEPLLQYFPFGTFVFFYLGICLYLHHCNVFIDWRDPTYSLT